MGATPAWPPRSAPRLFVQGPLAQNAAVTVDGGQAHYLAKVMRVAPGDAVMLCDDMTGEWASEVVSAGKRDVVLEPRERLREREEVPQKSNRERPRSAGGGARLGEDSKGK